LATKSSFHFGPKLHYPFPNTFPATDPENMFGASPFALSAFYPITNAKTIPKWFGTMPPGSTPIYLKFYKVYGEAGYTNIYLRNNSIFFDGNARPAIYRYSDSNFSKLIKSYTVPAGTASIALSLFNVTNYANVIFQTVKIDSYRMYISRDRTSANPNDFTAHTKYSITPSSTQCTQIYFQMQSYVHEQGNPAWTYLIYSYAGF
jgi:hypothetical protein